jgi:hypothetical protein
MAALSSDVLKQPGVDESKTNKSMRFSWVG